MENNFIQPLRKIVLTLVFLFFIYPIFSQNLTQINQDRIDRTKTGMLVLGGWAVSNIAASAILRRNTSGSTTYFYDMNIYWNVVNLAIAGFSYYSLGNEDPSSFGLAASLAEQNNIEKILLLNTGLDVGYVAAGFYLKERGANKDSDRLTGFGNSLILQGGFLFVFDLAFYFVQKKGSTQLMQILENVQVGAGTIGYVHKF